jgi:hypothetical protein
MEKDISIIPTAVSPMNARLKSKRLFSQIFIIMHCQIC